MYFSRILFSFDCLEFYFLVWGFLLLRLKNFIDDIGCCCYFLGWWVQYLRLSLLLILKLIFSCIWYLLAWGGLYFLTGLNLYFRFWYSVSWLYFAINWGVIVFLDGSKRFEIFFEFSWYRIALIFYFPIFSFYFVLLLFLNFRCSLHISIISFKRTKNLFFAGWKYFLMWIGYKHFLDSFDLSRFMNNLWYLVLNLAVFSFLAQFVRNNLDAFLGNTNSLLWWQCLNLIQFVDHVERLLTILFFHQKLTISLNQLILGEILLYFVDDSILPFPFPLFILPLERNISFKEFFLPSVDFRILGFIYSLVQSYQNLHWPLSQKIVITISTSSPQMILTLFRSEFTMNSHLIVAMRGVLFINVGIDKLLGFCGLVDDTDVFGIVGRRDGFVRTEYCTFYRWFLGQQFLVGVFFVVAGVERSNGVVG